MVSSISLRGHLFVGMKQSAFEKTPSQFLPAGTLNKMISANSILGAMDISDPIPDDEELLEFIVTRGKKLFAIAVYIRLDGARLRRAMALFKSWPFDDEQLPIKKMPGEKIFSNMMTSEQHMFMRIEGDVLNDNAQIWTPENIMDFQEAQDKFLAPVFSDSKTNHDVFGLVIPFVEREKTKAEGYSGIVSKYKIHEDHILDHKRPANVSYAAFAVKEIKVNNDQDRQQIASHWQSEVRAMATMNTLDHKGHIVHFVTAFRRGSLKNPDYYVITEWAEGGNLRDMWLRKPKPKLTASLVKEVLTQLLGLAEAFNAAHNLKTRGVTSGASYRHGDLKPENILCFPDGSEIGTLKICDWGEAKNKQVATAMRHTRTTAKFGTRRYEPPEVETGVRSMLGGKEENRRSRLYDIWALGCITLEFLVWLLYGVDGLDHFNKSVKSELNSDSPFYQPGEHHGKKIAWVHNVVRFWMKYMSEDAACRAGTTALGDLLEIVDAGLLVVKLPREGGTFKPNHQQLIPDSSLGRLKTNGIPAVVNNSNGSTALSTSVDSPHQNKSTEQNPSIKITAAQDDSAEDEPRFLTAGPPRLRANQLRERLEHIVLADEGNSYWSTGSDKPIPSIPDDLYARVPQDTTVRRFRRSGVDYGQPRLDPDKWEYAVDNTFAKGLFKSLSDRNRFPLPQTPVSSKICNTCKTFRDTIWDMFFTIKYTVDDLKSRPGSDACGLCALLWRTCKRNKEHIFPEVSFERTGSFLKMNGGQVPVLSVSRPLEYKNSKVRDIQIGFSELSEAGSATHLQVIRQWLSNCDEMHPSCRLIQEAHKHSPLPTRLIDVGAIDDDDVRLQETRAGDTGEWIALSHRWGAKSESHFCTTTENYRAHLSGIKLAQLPNTFRDAVVVTRALGCRYLWIDSICIIQEGKDADFMQEGKRMEDVYSGARCVIAASCASSHASGFLKPRYKRDLVALRREQDGTAPFFVCEMIDDFKKHVLDGELHQRGWVLQEHALARRTVFFDHHQTYWECGYGVQCETMNTLHNESAKLLGDPNFPKILDAAKQGERILRLQKLWHDYSRLGLSKQYDRPNAIAGLQQRLLRTMNVQGDFGIFDDGKAPGLLRRCLLWHRGSDTPRALNRVEFPDDQTPVPTWSWMAWTGGKIDENKEYPGGIDYFDLEFAEFDWEEDIHPPWSRSPTSDNTSLTARARKFEYDGPVADEANLVFDSPAESERDRACVVLGVQAGSFSIDDKRHYVLIIAEAEEKETNSEGERVWERIGAGYLPGKVIQRVDFPVSVR